MLPPPVFDAAMADSNAKSKNVILSTQDFLHGVNTIRNQLKLGTSLMLVAAPQFSGLTSCVQAASQGLNVRFISLVFSTTSWVIQVLEALSLVDDHPLVLHILLPFDQMFCANSSSLLLHGAVFSGANSILRFSPKVTLVFEMITPITSHQQIPIPTFTFSTPLVTSSELLNYWLVNKDLRLSYDEREYVRSIVSSMIDSSLQLLLFFNLFAVILVLFPVTTPTSLAQLTGYCVFWSWMHEIRTRKECEDYSAFVVSKFPEWVDFPGNIWEYMYEEPRTPESFFGLTAVYRNPLTFAADESLIAHYSEFECGPIHITNIPTPQFVNAFQQFVPFLRSGKSCVLIGPSGSGKSTILRFLVAKYFHEPDFVLLYFNGGTLTTDELYGQLLSVSVMTVEGILEPRKGASCIIAIDEFPGQGELYSSVLSIIETGNAVFDRHIRPFRRVSFILTMDQESYQLSTCCAVLSMVPYAYSDYEFIAHELILRIFLQRHFSSSAISHYCSSVAQFLPPIVQVMEANREKVHHLHFFFALLRSVENIRERQIVELSDFFLWRMHEVLPPSVDLPGFVHRFE
jgi:energy-coupling factor transporter ATP-binding protein EcfA2